MPTARSRLVRSYRRERISWREWNARYERRLLPKEGVYPAGGVVCRDTAPPTAELDLEIDVRTYDRELHLPA